jgi:hypothetical protein
MLGYMKLIEDNPTICFRQMCPMYGSHMSMAMASIPLICSAVRVAQKPSSLLCLRFFGHVQYTRSYQIIDQRQIAVSLPKSLLIDTIRLASSAWRRSKPRFTARSRMP